MLPAARAGEGEPLAEELELNVLCALGCDLVEENVSIRDFQRVGGTVLSAIEAKAHGLWLSGKLIWVSLKGEPWLLVEGEGNTVSLSAPGAAPGCCRLEPFVVGRNRQHPALHGIRPQSLTSGAFKKKKKKRLENTPNQLDSSIQMFGLNMA